jgi:hypothetical protein
MKVSTGNDNNFGYKKITILVDNIPLNLTSISYSFWNKGQKVLTFWKFDEKKGNYSKMGTQIYFKIAG